MPQKWYGIQTSQALRNPTDFKQTEGKQNSNKNQSTWLVL